MGTKKTIRSMEEWGKTASERDIQFAMLLIAVETRDKIETIRSIVTVLFILWLIGVVVFIGGALSLESNSGGF